MNLVSNPENSGLQPAVRALAGIVNALEDEDLGVSRADIWAYAALVGAVVSQDDVMFTDGSVDRGHCNPDEVNCAEAGPDTREDFPSL